MENEEFVQFLKSTLIKIENAIYLLKQKGGARHIPAYNKILGVQQKLFGLGKEHKAQMFSQLITTRSIIYYFMNGRYEDSYKQILKLKKELIEICIRIEKSERDKDK